MSANARFVPILLLVLAAALPAPLPAQAANQITEVSPDSGVAGATGLLVTFTLDADAISVAPVASSWPPVADGKLGGVAATFSPDASLAGWIDVTYDAATCSGQKAVVLYGILGDFSTYQGCAASAAGDSGTAIIDAGSLGDVWFNIVWTGGSTAGHPGYGFDGTEDVERSWNAAGFCGVTGDDHGHASCP